MYGYCTSSSSYKNISSVIFEIGDTIGVSVSYSQNHLFQNNFTLWLILLTLKFNELISFFSFSHYLPLYFIL
jgi:hypothetical protein